MKKNILLFVALGAILFAACNKDRTTYQVSWCFDNTDMKTEMVKVFECTDSAANGKWRSDFHKTQMTTIDGVEHEMVSGTIKDVARSGANELWVYAEGDNDGFHEYRLDTIFKLQPGVDNVFQITPDSKWIANPLYD